MIAHAIRKVAFGAVISVCAFASVGLAANEQAALQAGDDSSINAALWIVLDVLLSEAGEPVPMPPPPDPPADRSGRVRFCNLATASFDAWSSNPSAQAQAWMREHYWRMVTFSPYFDSRLDWYPDAWVYKNAYGIEKNSSLVQSHPEWILRDAQGNALYIPFGCSNGSCSRYAGDFGNPAFRAHWIASAQDLMQRGYRGIWLDDVNFTWRVGNGNGNSVTPIDPRTGTQMTLANWRRYFAEFLEQVRAALTGAELTHNVIWFAGPTPNDDPFIKRAFEAADFINLERGLNDGGLTGGTGRFSVDRFFQYVDGLQGLGRQVTFMDYGDTLPEREYGLAGWLAVSDGQGCFTSNQRPWTTPDNWWPGYELDLGAAQGGRYLWNGVFRRDFSCGMVLINEPGAPTRSLGLPGSFETLSNATVSSVQLGPSSAAVLLKSCACYGDECSQR